MTRFGILLTGLMLITAQVPWIACPCDEIGGLEPAVRAHAHDHDDHGHAHHHHGHHHHHAPAKAPVTDGPHVEAPGCVHCVVLANLVADARQCELPSAKANVAPAPLAVVDSRFVTAHTLEGAYGLEPPPPRPPSAACLADKVRLLS